VTLRSPRISPRVLKIKGIRRRHPRPYLLCLATAATYPWFVPPSCRAKRPSDRQWGDQTQRETPVEASSSGHSCHSRPRPPCRRTGFKVLTKTKPASSPRCLSTGCRRPSPAPLHGPTAQRPLPAASALKNPTHSTSTDQGHPIVVPPPPRIVPPIGPPAGVGPTSCLRPPPCSHVTTPDSTGGSPDP